MSIVGKFGFGDFASEVNALSPNLVPLNSGKHKLATFGTMKQVFLIVLMITFSLLIMFNKLEAFVRAFTSEAALKATLRYLILKNIS